MTGVAAVELVMIGLVIVLAIAAGLVLGLLLRRRSSSSEPVAPEAVPVAPRPPVAVQRQAAIRQQVARRARASQAPAHGGALGTVSTAARTSEVSPATGTTDRACPSCRTAYHDMLYCQRDARKLVPAHELGAAARSSGVACPGCGRSFEPGLRRCPHDGLELVPQATYDATRGRPPPAPTGVLAKACPLCRRTFDLSSRFCGRDGHELVVVN